MKSNNRLAALLLAASMMLNLSGCMSALALDDARGVHASTLSTVVFDDITDGLQGQDDTGLDDDVAGEPSGEDGNASSEVTDPDGEAGDDIDGDGSSDDGLEMEIPDRTGDVPLGDIVDIVDGIMDEAMADGLLVDNGLEFQAASIGYDVSFRNVVIGREGDVGEAFDFQAQCTGAGIVADTTSVTGNGYGTFSLTFASAGSYTVNITCATESGNGYVRDERTLEVNLSVTESNGTYRVTETSQSFKLNGTATGTQDAFVIRCNEGFQWSESTKQQAQEIMDGMTLEEKVGQLFIAHYPGDGSGSNEQAAALVEAYHPGAFLVFAAMFNNRTPRDVIGKVNAAQAAAVADTGIPMFFSVDEEGGNVVRISDKAAYGHSKFPSQLSMAGKGAAAIEADALDKAEFLQGLGMNVNHAPVADVSGASGYMYKRERVYGGDPLMVAEYVAASVRGHNAVANIGTSIKHFPGYGSTSSDTHNGFAINNLSRGDFDYGDLLPFYAGIAAGSKSVMVTHNIIECMDTENPASLSSAVVDVLRNDMNFDGVIMTDDLNMGAIIQAVGTGNAALACLQAGVDMPMCNDVGVQVPKVIAAVNDGTLSLGRVEESCLRVLCWKIEMGLIEKEYPDVPPVPDDPEAQWTDGTETKTGSFESMWALAAVKGGTVKLMQDVDTVGNLSVSSKDVTLNINGHKLHFTSGTNGFIVEGGGTFTLTDTVVPVEATREEAVITEEASYNSVRRELLYYTRPGDGSVVMRHDVNMDAMGMVDGDLSGILIEVKNGTFNLDGGMVTSKIRAVESVNNAGNVINIRGGAIVNCGVAQGGSTANGSGIGIYGGGTLNISGGYIAGNEATTRGGGVIVDSGKLNMTGGVLAVNSTPTNGGAVYMNSNTTATVSGGVIACNHAGSQAGGIYVLGTGSTLTVDGNAMFTMNTTKGNGGAIFTMSGWGAGGTVNLYVKDGLFTGNEANNGGAIRTGSSDVNGGFLSVSGGKFYYNNAKSEGGAIHMNGLAGGCSVAGAVFSHNMAGTNGGAFSITGQTSASLKDVTVVDNEAGGLGGGIYHNGAALTLNGYIRVNANTVGTAANDLYLPSGKYVTLANVLAGNSLVRFYTENLPTETSAVDVVKATNKLWLTNSMSMFKSDRPGNKMVLNDGKIVLAVGSGSHEGTEIQFNGILFQYYSTLNRVSDWGDAKRRLNVIDTTGGVLPHNGVYPKGRYLYLNEDGSVKMDSILTEIYTPEDILKDNLRPLDEMNKFATESSYYALAELWVAPSGQYAGSIDKDDWTVYPWSSELSLTTDVSKIDANTIYIDTGSVVRFVCKPVSGTEETSVVFYDYDISDGHIYPNVNAAFNKTGQMETSRQPGRDEQAMTSYMNTIRQGINHPDNYADKSLALFGFGNANMQTGLEGQNVNGYSINSANRGLNNFELCNFGLVTGLDENGHLIYNPKVSAPSLFDEGSAVGKTVVSDRMLGFVRDGDSYTLNSVSGTSLDGLSVFGHPGIYDGVQNKTCIWTNNFWPMDEMGTFGTDGHDFKFGDSTTKVQGTMLSELRKVVNADGMADRTPLSDDWTDHNAYFGMQFAIEFELESDYVGPMEYYFFGDDDMWVFLDDKLVSDVGGVHRSAGSYVNLWDWVEKGSSGTHILRFFFTERGASGSTCWMRFNIPHMQDITHEVVNLPGSLKIQKTVEGIETDRSFEFTVTLDLQSETGEVLADRFTYIGSKTGMIRSGETVSLANGEYIIIQNLPEGTTYTVRETRVSGFVPTCTGDTGTIGDGTSTANFVNTYQGPCGTLRISKKAVMSPKTRMVVQHNTQAGSAVTQSVEFPFTVVLTDADGNELTGEFEFTGTKSGTIRSGDTIMLGDADFIDILDLPAGTQYIVTEGVTDGWYLDESVDTTGVIQDQELSHAKFVNRESEPLRTGSLVISKTVKRDSYAEGVGDAIYASDGIPDDCQVVVDFTVVNGTPEWSQTCLTLRDTDGNPSEDGTAVLTEAFIPEIYPDEGMSVTQEFVPDVVLTKNAAQEAVCDDEIIDTVTVIWVDGLNECVIKERPGYMDVPDESAYPIAADHDGYRFTGWTVGELDDDGNVIIVANYDKYLPVNLACLYQPGGVAMNNASVSIVKIATYESDGSLKVTQALEETGIDWHAIATDMQTMTESELTEKYGYYIYVMIKNSKITYSGTTGQEAVGEGNSLFDGVYVVHDIPAGVYSVFSTDTISVSGIMYEAKPSIVVIPSGSSGWIEFQFGFDSIVPGPGGPDEPDVPDVPDVPDPDSDIDIPDPDLPL